MLNQMFMDYLHRVAMAPADEGGAGGGDGGEAPAGGDAAQGGVAIGGDAGGDGDDSGIAIGGGTAEGQDNPDGADDGDGKAAEGGDAKGDDKASEAEAPETYTFDNLPEGMEVDATLAEAITPVFKELGLTQVQADLLTKAYADVQQKALEAADDAFEGMVAGWRKTAMKDPEIGGDRWSESVKMGNDLVAKFGDKQLVEEVLVAGGMGNHPAMIRFLRKVGAQFANDTVVPGTQVDTTGPADQAKTWYGNTTPDTKKG